MEIVREVMEKGKVNQMKLKDILLSGRSEVVKIYDGAVVFVTGGSGFVGKQLVEKILRTCNIKKIYLLLRPKKGKTAMQRLKQTLEDPVYDLLRTEQPNFESKLVPIEGDVIDLNLGMDEEIRKKIAEEINFIFHGAATVNFGETVKFATLTNIRGTREMLNLAKICKQLKSVVHISTAYVHATRSRFKTEITEDFYQSPLPPDALIQLAEELETEQLEKMIEPLMQEWPNTYTFTKAVTEELIRQKAADLPLCIVRPAIVVAASKEPTPGWVDVKNAYGPSGILLGISLGVAHVIYADSNMILDLVPVDIVNNAILAAAWDNYQSYSAGERQIKIYFVTGARNPMYFSRLSQDLNKQARQMLSPRAMWYCFAAETKYKFMFMLLTWLFHYIPALVIDGFCMLIGKKPRLMKVYKKVYALSSALSYFTNNDWIFRDDNTVGLYSKLQDSDKEMFNCDMMNVDITDMVTTWFYGVGKFIIKDDVTQYSYSVKKQWWLRLAHYIFMPIYLYCLFKIAFLFFAYIFYFYKIFMSV